MATIPTGIPDPAGKHVRFYRPELDVLRFLAFLLVFIHHAHLTGEGPFAGSGAYGMCIFFMLSAFLIAELLLRERERTGTVHVQNFYIRRILRIWPLYFFALALALVASKLLPVPLWHIDKRALPYLLLLASNFYVPRYGWNLGLVGALWSLAIEEQFYLVVPTVAKWGGKAALAALSVLCLPLAYGTLAVLGHRGVDPQQVVWVNTLVQSQYFAAGILMAITLRGRRWTPGWTARAAIMAAGVAAFYLVERVTPLDLHTALTTGQLSFGYFVVLLGSMAIFLSLFGAPVRFPKWLTYLGRISFGLYVFHDFVLTAAFHFPVPRYQPSFPLHHPHLASLVCLAVTILIAAASFELFEKRMLVLKERFAFVKSGAR